MERRLNFLMDKKMTKKKVKKNKGGRPKNCGRCKKPKTQCKCGRPTKMTKEVINKLEQAFANGATNLQACFYAGISEDTLYNYEKKNPKFAERRRGLKAQLGLIAKNNIAKSIKGGSIGDSWKHLEATEKKVYAKGVQVSGEDGEPIRVITEIRKTIIDPKKV